MKKSKLMSVVVVLVLMAALLLSGCENYEEEQIAGPTEEGLVAHFAFEGNLIDSTGNFADGELIGTKIGPSIGEITDVRGEEHYSISYVDGVEGSAIKFDGTQGVLMPRGLIDGSTYTISLWINPAVVTQHTTTFFGAVSGSSWISVVPDGPTTHYTMLWSGENWYDATAGLTIPTNEWTHFVASVDRGEVKVYLNGELKFEGQDFPDIFRLAGGEGIFALAVNWWDLPFIGMLDELKIYNVVKTPDEIE